MHFKKKFYKYFFLITSFITTAKSDLPSQLNNLKTGLNGLKGRLGVLKGALEGLKEELGKENKFDEFINTVSTDKDQKISETDLPPELKAIPVSTKEEKNAFKEKLTETFEKLPENKLDILMGSVLYDQLSGDDQKKLVQTAAAQAWVNTLKKDLSSEDEKTVNISLDKFVEGATVYVEKHCTVPIPEFQQPNDFLSKVFDSLSDPETSLKQLEEITKKKEKDYKKKKTDEFVQLSNIQKNSLKNIKELTKKTIIIIANAYFTGHLHSLFDGRPNDLNAFREYLVNQEIEDDKALELVDFLKTLNKDNLSSLIDTSEKIENLAYLKVLLEFLSKEELLDKFSEKINPTTSLNPLASFFAGGDQKLTDIENKKDQLLKTQMSEIDKFENKAFRNINNYIDGENRFHTLKATIDHKNFIAAFVHLEKFETLQQKEKFKKFLKNDIISNKTASSFSTTRSDFENINDKLESENPIFFLNEEDIVKKDQKKFITNYNTLFRYVFKTHAYRHANPLNSEVSLKNYLKDVFDCFDKTTKILLFKNKNEFSATINDHQTLMYQIEQSFYEIVESFYQDRFINDAVFTTDDIVSLLLVIKGSFIVRNFTYIKTILFNDILDPSLSLCSNIALQSKSLVSLFEDQKITLLQIMISVLKSIEETETNSIKKKENPIETSRAILLTLKKNLETAEDENDTEEINNLKERISTITNSLLIVKNKAKALIDKYIKNNFDSSEWKPTSLAFFQISYLSLKLNLEENLDAINNWDKAIQENRGGSWHEFLINDTKARSSLREVFNRLKYQHLFDANLIKLFNKIKIDAWHEIDIDMLAKLFPQYSQYWLDLVEKLFEKMTTKESEIKFFKEKLKAMPEELQNYLLIQTYFQKKITEKIQDWAKSNHLNDVLLMIKGQPSSITIEKLKQDVPQWSSAWYALVKSVLSKLGPSTCEDFTNLISTKSPLREYLGEHSFIDDVLNTAKKTQRADVNKVFIDDPRTKKKA